MKEELKVLNKNEKVQANESGLGIALASENSHSSFSTLRSSFTKSTLGGGRKTNNMKKLMIAASAAFCAAVGFADITSANIVGYNTVTLKPGWNMLAVNFKNVANDDGIDINDLFPGGGKTDTKFTAGASQTAADYIQVWDATGGKYTTYLLFKPSKGSSTAAYYWTDLTLKVAEKKFKNGDAFWFYKRGDQDVTASISGEVSLDAVKEVAIKPGWNMIGSFFPAGWKLNDEYYNPTYWQNSGAVAGASQTAADYVQVWDATSEKYTTYLLFKPSKGSSTATYTWTDLTLKTVTTDVLTAGKGAWYYHRGSGFNLEIKKQF